MDREEIQYFIKECRPYMIQQLQKEVVYFLKDNSIITDSEFDQIITFSSREQQIIIVLDILPTKQFNQLNCFIQYVSDWYSWIIYNFKRNSQIVDYAVKEKDKMLNMGEVPPLPIRHVQRKEEYANLCKFLHELKRNQYIVVHGMRGCGKSTLVVDVLRHSYTLALDTFKQKVFWLTVGRESFVDELTIQQELCSKLMLNRAYGLQTLPLDSKSAKLFLKDKLMNAELEDCLLILDDVSSPTIIQALDVGCRILVTTDDTAVMNQTRKEIHYVKVSEGFTEDETLKLFSQSIDSEKLPNQAKMIYSICKGFPLTISLISSQLEEHKEDVTNNTRRWDIYVSKLKEKNLGAAIGPYDIAKQEQVTSLYKAVGMSIDSLHSNLKDLYQDFALFMNDVNIKAEVLCTLWQRQKKDVEDIMREFERKCLVVRAFNHSHNCYIYCVHDLLLNYLKDQISTPQKEALHLKLIKQYQKKFGEDINNFPVDDNYILLYLGYHLKEANLVDKFPTIFLDLNFINTKIMNFGAADLLLDFRKYREFIAHDPVSTKSYEDVLHFIKHVGACKSTSNSNIVQFGLCEHKDSFVYKMATAMSETGKYFEILSNIPEEKSAPVVYFGREEIVAATFASDTNVIVANSTGTIKMVKIPENQTLISFRGHENKITQLQLTKNLIYFLSASDDCTVRIWYLNDYSSLEKNFSEKPRTPSPQLRQANWLDPFPNQRLSSEAAVAVLDEHNLPVKHAQFSNLGTMIVSTADDLQTILWKLVLQRKELNLALTVTGHEVIESKEQFESCVFSNDDEIVLCADRKGRVLLYRSSNGARISTVEVGEELLSMSVIPGVPLAILVLHKHRFHVVTIIPESTSNSDEKMSKVHQQTIERKREDHFICSTLSWDGMYVAIATKNRNILIFELVSNNKVAKFTENSANICGLSWSRQNTALLTSYETELLKIWHFSPNGVLSCAPKLRPSVFDAQWIYDLEEEDSTTDRLLVTAALDCRNEIHVFYDLQEKRVLAPSSNAEIIQCCVCPFDGNIVYAHKNGNVNLVILDSWETHQIMNVFCLRLWTLKIFAHGNRLLVMVLAETAPGKVSLIGCMSRGGNEFSRDLIFYERDSEILSKFSADLSTNSVYVIDNNHILKVYACRTAEKKLTVGTDLTECCQQVKFCDISANFSHVVTGNDKYGFIQVIRPVRGGAKKIMSVFESVTVNAFKFNHDGRKLAVGFSSGCFNIFETESNSKLHSFPPNDAPNPLKFATGQVIDFIWSADDTRLLVIFHKEIILFSIGEQLSLESILFATVDKIVCNQSFTKCVTIDSEGQFQAIQFPRN